MTAPFSLPSDAALAADLASLRTSAPETLLPRSLIAVGLADAYAAIDSPIGPLFVAFNGLGVAAVEQAPDAAAFERSHVERFGRPAYRVATLPARLAHAIDRRLSGDRRARIALDLRGRSAFERDVWTKALEIPHGEVRPYGWIAAEIGRPKAVRAVGTALGHNPVPLIVPCHRVVRSDGLIGNYSLGGPANKRTILSAEGLDPDELESLARAGIRYIGSDTTKIYCLPSCHAARRVTERHRVEFHSAAEGHRAGYRACRLCRPTSATVAA
jgi:O-6-methylguanine DNA methyltransferase